MPSAFARSASVRHSGRPNRLSCASSGKRARSSALGVWREPAKRWLASRASISFFFFCCIPQVGRLGCCLGGGSRRGSRRASRRCFFLRGLSGTVSLEESVGNALRGVPRDTPGHERNATEGVPYRQTERHRG